MKGKKWFGLLLVLFTIFGLSLNAYSNAKALNYSVDLVPTGGYTFFDGSTKCYYLNNETLQQTYAQANAQNECIIYNNDITKQVYLRFIATGKTITLTEGNYYSLILSLTHNDINQFSLIWDPTFNTNWLQLEEFEKLSTDQIESYCNRYTAELGGGYGCGLDAANEMNTNFYRFTVRARRSGDFNFVIGYSGSNRTLAVLPKGNFTRIQLYGLFEYKLSGNEEMNKKDDEDRNNIEQQSESSDSEANKQGDEASQTGTSLFSAFTQLLGALTNVSGNSCTLPNMQIYSLNLGNMNLCEYDIPPQIMALVSIGMVFIIVPLGIHLVKKMIALYKEITG